MADFENQDWWTAPTEGDAGQTVIVTGRRDIDRFRAKGKYNIRVEVSYDYSASDMSADGLPDSRQAEVLDKVTERFHHLCKVEKGVVLTGIFTGEGLRDWVFYTISLRIFQISLNKALADMPLLPLSFHAEEDPGWEAYGEMRQASEVTID